MLLLAAEDLRTLSAGSQATGPVISGSLQPQRRADLRAEVGAIVKQVLKDNGEQVRSGDLIVRLDDTAIRDSLASAEEVVRAASQAFEQAGIPTDTSVPALGYPAALPILLLGLQAGFVLTEQHRQNFKQEVGWRCALRKTV